MRGWSNFLDWTCRREISGPRVYVCVLVSTGSLFSNCSQVPSPPPAGMKAFPTFLSTFGVICVFSLFAYPKGAKWYPVVLMCMFLITVEVQHTYTPPPPHLSCPLSTVLNSFLPLPVLEVAASTCFSALRSGQCNPTTEIWCLVWNYRMFLRPPCFHGNNSHPSWLGGIHGNQASSIWMKPILFYFIFFANTWRLKCISLTVASKNGKAAWSACCNRLFWPPRGEKDAGSAGFVTWFCRREALEVMWRLPSESELREDSWTSAPRSGGDQEGSLFSLPGICPWRRRRRQGVTGRGGRGGLHLHSARC